ncbi:MAG: SLATT domain-containing protein [Anaerolineae bacterium]|nr:SLATT domain-containing protein [Anaerolineae bacterium]
MADPIPAPAPGTPPTPDASTPLAAPLPAAAKKVMRAASQVNEVESLAAPLPGAVSAPAADVPLPAPPPNGLPVPAPPSDTAAFAPSAATRAAPVSDTLEMVATPSLTFDATVHNDEDIKLLYEIYTNKRLQSQIDFYQSRIRENERNSDFTFRAGALILTVSSLIATISASVTPTPDNQAITFLLRILAAVLPAFAALIASFRQLYGWDKQATIYRESLLALERVSLLMPDDDRLSHTNLNPIYPELVRRTEDIFSSEVSQWGQFILAKEKTAGEGEQDVVARSASNFALSEEGRASLEGGLETPAPAAARAPAAAPPAPSAPRPAAAPPAPAPADSDTGAG